MIKEKNILDTEFIIGRDKLSWKVRDNFPDITQGNVGVFLSGGIESTLIAIICCMIYGRDRTLLFYSDSIFHVNKEGYQTVTDNAKNIANLLGMPIHYVDIDQQIHQDNIDTSVANVKKNLIEKYNIKYTLWGFTKLFFEVEDLKQPGATVEESVRRAFENKDIYAGTIEEFHLETGTWSGHLVGLDISSSVWIMLRKNSDMIWSPLRKLNKHEVIDLYYKLGLEKILKNTRSCVAQNIEHSKKHCGACFNCQQRHDGFDILGVNDPTEYIHKNAIVNRIKLKELRSREKYEFYQKN